MTTTLRRTAISLATESVLFVVAPPAVATTTSEKRIASYINASRASAGKRALYLSESLSDVARAHSRKMGAAGRIVHSNLSDTVRNFSWRVAGENVGVGATMYRLHKAFMASPGHGANSPTR